MMRLNMRNPEVDRYSPGKSRASKNYQLSTTCFEISKGRSIQFKNSNRKYTERCSHQQHNNKHLIFKPCIKELPYRLYPNSQDRKLNKSREQIRQKLIEDATKTIQSRLKAKIKMQNQQFKKHSFHPQISDFAKELSRYEENEPIFEKLFNEAEQIKQQRIQIQKKKDEQQKKQIDRLLNYKLELNRNKIVLNNQKHNLVPIENRIQEIVQNRIKHRKELQEQLQKQKDINFQPSINLKSEQLAARRIQRQKLKVDVVERLMQEYQRTKKNKESSLQAAKLKQLEYCTFNPQINRNYTVSRMINSERSQFFERLRKYHEECEDQYNNFSFVPQINTLSDLIVQHKRGKEDMSSRLDRLIREPVEKKRSTVDKIRFEIQSDLTFKPKLNEITSIMHAEHRPHACEQPPLQVFTFQPTINQKSKLIRPQSAEITKLKKNKKMLEYKLESEYEQLKQCSFQPRINNYRHQDQRVLGDVEGIQTFMNFQQKAKQKITLQKQRQRDLFQLQIKYDERKNSRVYS